MTKPMGLGHRAGIDEDFRGQVDAIAQAEKNFSPPAGTSGTPGVSASAAPTATQGKAQVRVNQQNASDMGL